MTTTVGIIANPASARDIRRLVAFGRAVTTNDKLNRLQCVMAGLAAAGVDVALSMADRGGITAGLLRLAKRPTADRWPRLEFVDQPVTQSASDTATAALAMAEAGVGAIVVLGGDGTNRIVASVCGDIPLVSISTGTNNAFPQPVEPTVAGLAAGLIAKHPELASAGTYRAKKLEVRSGDRAEDGLVDVAITTTDTVGSGAIWDSSSIQELFLCFAEANAIGLSAIGSYLKPTSRQDLSGIAIALGEPAATTVHAPIAPGLFADVAVKSVADLQPDVAVAVTTPAGIVAIDGERMFRFGPASQPTVTLRRDGPLVVDVAATMEHAAAAGLLARGPDGRG